MWITFYCGNCGNQLDFFHESHDSIEFILDKSNLNCWKCEENNLLIKITVHRG